LGFEFGYRCGRGRLEELVEVVESAEGVGEAGEVFEGDVAGAFEAAKGGVGDAGAEGQGLLGEVHGEAQHTEAIGQLSLEIAGRQEGKELEGCHGTIANILSVITRFGNHSLVF